MQAPRNNLNSRLVFILLGGLILLFILAPLVRMFFASSPQELVSTAADPEVAASIWLTLWTSMAITLIMAIGAIPLAYLLARGQGPFKRIVNGLIDLPIVIPHTAAGIAILGFVNRDSLVGQAGSFLGIDFVGHPAGIMAAMAFVSLPFLINAARDGFQAVPVRLEKAALNLGASPSRVFFTISLPLAWRSILTGIILMFARGMSEFGAVVIVAYHPMVTPVLIYERFGAFGLKYARPVSILFILVALCFFILLRWLSKKNHHAGN